jgi:hypothetical protein
VSVAGVLLDEVRLGGRNFIRPGDVVRVKPSRPAKHDGFDALVRRIVDTQGGVEVEVFGGAHGRAAVRTFTLDRLERRRQPGGAANAP